MKKALFVAATVTLMLALTPFAGAGYGGDQRGPIFRDEAEVIHVEPIIRTVEIAVPERECWEEEVRFPAGYGQPVSPTRAIAGGIIGGVIGNQVGRGRGKTAATIAGTVLGASIGHDLARRSAARAHGDRIAYEQRCRTIQRYRTEERTEGYWVTYRYRGETFKTRLPYDPGDRLTVRVTVAPVRE